MIWVISFSQWFVTKCIYPFSFKNNIKSGWTSNKSPSIYLTYIMTVLQNYSSWCNYVKIIFPQSWYDNTLDSQLIAPPVRKMRKADFLTQYIPMHLPHVSPQWWHIAAKQSAHIVRATRTFWSLLSGCTAYTARTAVHTLKCAYAVWYAVISRSTQNHSYAVYWIGRWWLFPTMQCRNGLLLACHWWRYALWILGIKE